MLIDKSHFFVDFSKNEFLSDEEKTALERIMDQYRPIERTEFLLEYIAEGKITEDDFNILTGIPYRGM